MDRQAQDVQQDVQVDQSEQFIQDGLSALQKKQVSSLPTTFDFKDQGQVTDGVAVTTYGKGKLTGVTYTVPAHGEITVDFEVNVLCVTPSDVDNLSALIRSLLDASKQHLFDELKKTEISGGASFFGFFGWGGASASYSDTKHTMDSWGLSEANQQAIVAAMMNVAQKVNTLKYHGTVYNRDYDYSVTGDMFAIVMDCDIKQSSVHNQVRFLAPNPHLEGQGAGGPASLPSVGNLTV